MSTVMSQHDTYLTVERPADYRGIVLWPTAIGMFFARKLVVEDVADIDRAFDDDYLDRMLGSTLADNDWTLSLSDPPTIKSKTERFVSTVKDPVRDWALGHPVRWRLEQAPKNQ